MRRVKSYARGLARAGLPATKPRPAGPGGLHHGHVIPAVRAISGFLDPICAEASQRQPQACAVLHMRRFCGLGIQPDRVHLHMEDWVSLEDILLRCSATPSVSVGESSGSLLAPLQ